MAANAHAQIDALNTQAAALQRTAPQDSIALSEQARKLAALSAVDGAPYQRGLAESLLNLGSLHQQLSHYQQALRFLWKAQLLFEELGDFALQAAALTALGDTHSSLGNYWQALELYAQALAASRQAGDVVREASLLNDIGYTHMCLGDIPRALPFLHDSLKILETRSELAQKATVLCTLSLAYTQMGQPRDGLVYGLRSATLHDWHKIEQGAAQSWIAVGKAYAACGDVSEAAHAFRLAWRRAEAHGYQTEVSRALVELGRLQAARPAEIDTAITTLREALSVAQAAAAKPSCADAHEALARLYKDKGDYAQAYYHLEHFQHLREQMLTENADRRLAAWQAMTEVEKSRREAEIYRLRTVELQQEINQREEAVAELNAFAHTVAHDLKSPISIVILAGEILKRDFLDHLEPDAAAFVQRMVQVGYKMSQIIDDLLMFASVRRQHVNLTEVDMRAVLEEVEERLEPMLKGAVIVHPETWINAMGQPQWIEEVWVNYLSNAIKYGGTPPRIEVGATPLPGGKVRYWVRDNGNGVSQALQPTLFTEFTRLDLTRGEGHGLGLAIVKRIVEKLGGEVGVESSGIVGEGSTFYFTLPGMAARKMERPAVAATV
jgi:signal transduction histidine kinase